MSVSPEEPRPTELRQQIARAILDGAGQGESSDAAADRVLGLEPIRRALAITARLDVEIEQVPNDDDLMHRADVWGFANGHNALMSRLLKEGARAVGVVDPKPEATK